MNTMAFSEVGVVPAAGDNVAVAVRRIDAGTRIGTDRGELVVTHTVPEGHRFAIRPVADGAEVLSWGRPFGTAIRPLAAGDYVVSERMLRVLDERRTPFAVPEEANIADRALTPYRFDESTFRPGAQVQPSGEQRTFLGYDRGRGAGVGTRNHIVIVATSSRTAAFVEGLGRRVQGLGAAWPGLDPVVTVVHTEGGKRRLGNNREHVLRTLAGYAVHPNVGAMLAVDEPGSRLTNAELRDHLAAHGYPRTGRPLEFLTRAGSVADDLARAERLLHSWVPVVAAVRRTEQPLSALSIALQCGGSDAFSGISANPLAGAVAREVVRHGGSAILAETDELIGAEDYILSNVRDLDTAHRFLAVVERFKEQVRRHGHTAETNVSGGNLWRGLYNISIKSLGAARKRDPQVRLDHVLEYGERLTEPGYAFMDSPGNDLESVAGQVATGATVVFFTTGNGSITNFPFVPTVKLVSTSGRFGMLPDEMDVDAGAFLTGTPMDTLTRDVLDRTVEVASGRRTAGERAGHSQVSLWRDWQLGVDAPAAVPGADSPSEEALTSAALALLSRPVERRLVETLRSAVPPRDVGLIMPTSICSGQVARGIAAELDAAARSRPDATSGPVRFAAPVHTEGCGVSSGASERLFSRLVVGHLRHPRVRNALLLEHGCEKTHNDYFRARVAEAGLDPAELGWASIQLDGGVAAVTEKVRRWFDEAACLPVADRPAAGTAPGVAGPVIALHALGPVPDVAARSLGRLGRAVLDAGGSAVLMEGSSLCDSTAFGSALGIRRPLAEARATLRHAAAPGEPGLHLSQGPGEDWLEVSAALAAAGAHAVVVHVVGSAVPGHPFVPVLQISADPDTVARNGDDLDAVLTGDTPAGTEHLAELVTDAVEDRHAPRSDRSGLIGFQVSRGLLGVSM